MIKKKAKRKATKTASKKKLPRSKKDRNPAAVRNDIAKIVESGAKRITKAVMEQAMTGQLAPAKYLFEMASIYPSSTDGSFSTKDEESLAETLMRSLGLPDKPIPRDEEDPLVPASVEEKPKPKAIDEEEPGAGSDDRSKAELEAGDESKQPVIV
jgi:hypothetical protein